MQKVSLKSSKKCRKFLIFFENGISSVYHKISQNQHSLNYFPQCPESMVGSSLPCYRPPAPPPSHRALGQSSPLQSARNDQLHPLKGLVCFASNHFHCHPHTSPGKSTYNCLLPRLLYTFIPFLFVHLHIFDSQ